MRRVAAKFSRSCGPQEIHADFTLILTRGMHPTKRLDVLVTIVTIVCGLAFSWFNTPVQANLLTLFLSTVRIGLGEKSPVKYAVFAGSYSQKTIMAQLFGLRYRFWRRVSKKSPVYDLRPLPDRI